MKLTPTRKAYLERTARAVGKRIRKRVSTDDIVYALIDLAILDEGVYDPDAPSEPVSYVRREIIQGERDFRTLDLGPEALIAHLKVVELDSRKKD